ncbi:MAG: putative 4-hydroxybenzoate polyprenyltransferase [Alistipes sp.]|nr:putative 4-hydroxybenzoate polyprenyltransferase [Alistipes sp.]MBR2975466.1 putative 4-hydroxybenzoate polyprenyltransferase [Alistipes sp.]
MNTVSRVGDYLRLVKFSHTIFAMPFALVSFSYALWSSEATFSWWLLAQVVLCMVFARNVAMGFNRYADRDIDKANPRTASREIPRGVISPRNALLFVVANGLLFVATAASINLLTALLSPVALAVVMGYSYCKRFTSAAHLVLGLSLAIAPAGAYIAVTGSLAVAPCLLSLVVLTWTAGFDIIYALQDAEFDRQRGLHSIPSRFSVATSLYISIALHAVSIAALVAFAWLYLPQAWPLWCGVGLFTAILVAEHSLVTPRRQRSIAIAFGTLNGLASLTLAIFVIADILIYG